MSDALSDGVSTVAMFIPRLLGFALILVIGYVIAKALAKAIDAVLEKAGFDRAVERGGVKKALSQSNYDASDIVGTLVFYTLMLFVLQAAFGVFGPNPISDLLSSVVAFIPQLIVAIVIIVVASAIATAVGGLIKNTLGGLSYGNLLAGIASAFILFLGVIAALNQIGVATTVTTPVLIAILAAIVGVIVVGVGGGLIRPMQQRWQDWLDKAEQEIPRVRQHVAGAPSVADQAREAKDQARDAYQRADAPEQPAAYQQPDAYQQPSSYQPTDEREAQATSYPTQAPTRSALDADGYDDDVRDLRDSRAPGITPSDRNWDDEGGYPTRPNEPNGPRDL